MQAAAEAAALRQALRQAQEEPQDTAHFRNLRSLVEAADGPAEAAQALEIREREQLWAQACDLFNRIGAEETAAGLRELLVLLEDFEMDRPPGPD